jgi:hypothetical protein
MRTSSFLAIAMLLAVQAQSQSTTAGSTPFVTDGNVKAIATHQGRTYIAGDFYYVGPQTPYGTALNASDGLATDFDGGAGITYAAKPNGPVYAAVSDGSNGWYIGGSFTSVGGSARNRLARIKSDGTLDADWNPNADGTVYALAVEGSTVYVGGDFSSIKGSTRNRIALVNNSDGTPQSWDPNADNTVRVIAVNSGKIYVGGDFTTFGPSGSTTTRNRLASFASGTSTPETWDPNANATVRALAVSGGTIYVGGDFTTFGSGTPTTRNRLASFASGTSTPETWDPNANATVRAIAVSGSTIYVGGDFTTFGSGTPTNCNRLASFTSGTNTPTGWDPSIGTQLSTYSINTLAVSGSEVVAGGSFRSASGVSKRNIVAMATSYVPAAGVTVYSTTWKGAASGDVYTLAVSGTRIYAGGAGHSIGGQNRKRLACLKSSGTVLTDWDSQLISNSTVTANALAVDVANNRLYLGGFFESVMRFNLNTTTNGTQEFRKSLAAFTLTDPDVPALDADFAPDLSNGGSLARVNTMALLGNNLFVGGNFTTVNNLTRRCLAAFNRSTASGSNRTLRTWDASIANGEVYALAASGTKLYVGGNFTTIGSTATYSCLAAFDGSTSEPASSPLAWSPKATGGSVGIVPYVYAITTSADGNTVYVGGEFFAIVGSSSVARLHLAAIDAASGDPTSWVADVDRNRPANPQNIVYSLLLSGSTLYVGGDFGILGKLSNGTDNNVAYLGAVSTGSNTNNAINWNTNLIKYGGSILDSDGRVTDGVRSLAIVGSDLYAGGFIVPTGGTTSYLVSYTLPSVSVAWGGSSGGNWDEVTNWSPQVVPTSSTDAIQIALGYPVMNTDFTLGAASGTTKSLTISGTGSLEIAAGKRFSVAATGTANFGGNSVILRSSAAGTASIGEISGSLSGAGNVTVERYIPTGRKWRLLTAPLTGSTNTSIFYNWQRNGVSNGTHGVEIWAPGGSNGLTAGGAAASILSYSSGWQSLTNTNSTELFSSTTNNAYAVFVTGPYGSTNISSGAAATTLSATGTLITGDHTKSFSGATAGQYFLVGNPYASPVNPASFREDQGNRTNLDNALYLWDAKQTGTNNVGRYVTFNIDAGTYSIDGGESSVGYSNTPTITQIQSGQAFFVRVSSPVSTTPSIRFREANKTSTGSHEMLGNSTTENKRYVRVQLSRDSAILDGVVTFFEPDASAAVDAKDAVKMMNSSENLGLRRDGKTLVFEHRPELKSTDTLYIALTQMNQAAYRLSVRCYGVTVEDGVRMELVDTYTKLRKELSATQANEVEFMVDDQPASSGDRYLIVMTKKAAAAGTTTEPASSVKMKPYPNPVTGSSPVRIGIDSERAPWGIRVVDASGRTVWSRSGVDATEGQVEIDFSRLGSGVYNVVMTDARGRRSVSKVVKH